MNTLEDYNFHLPEELIAQQGAQPRDASRLMVLHRSTQRIEHRVFRQLVEYLRPGDVLVVNQSKVIPARLFATNPQGTPIEVLLVREAGAPQRWEALLKPAKRAKGVLRFSDALQAEVVGVQDDGTRLLEFSDSVWLHLEALGQTPLPPYIHSSVEPSRYQTVYAKQPGSVAAPTAGLHFTPELLGQIQAMGVELCSVTLHVGPGTFKPVHDDPDKHIMHQEPYEVSAQTAALINTAKAQNRRVVAVGTTVVRTLESAHQAYAQPGSPLPEGVQAETQLFIRPGFRFGVVDALITNFHLPKSTLLMLVSAFAGHQLMLEAYRSAVQERYRFYSLGDAMFIA